MVVEKGQWTKELMQELLTNNDTAVKRGLVKLFEYQTSDEQVAETTKYYNSVGFRACDAKKMSGIANFYLEKKFMSPKQLNYVRTKLVRTYATQLTRIANGEQ